MTKRSVAIKAVSFIAAFYKLRLMKFNATLPNYQSDTEFMKLFKTERVRLYVVMKERQESFYKERLRLKTRWWGEPTYIKAMTEKVTIFEKGIVSR